MSEAKTSASSDVALAAKNSTALAEFDEFLTDDMADGLDDFSQGDFLVPYLRILQSLSKELQKQHPKYIKGAEVGEIINSATKRTWNGDEGMYVIPLAFSHRYQAWRPNNGGPADDYGDNDAVYKSLTPNDKGKRVNADGNEVTDACQYFVFVVDPETGDYEMGVLSMSGSQAKKSRQWNSLMASRKERRSDGRTITPPTYYYAYKVTTVPESNEQGSWYGFSIEDGLKVPDLPNGKDIFLAAKETRERIQSGQIKTQAEEVDGEADLTEGEEKAF